MIHYTVQFLVKNGVEEIFVFTRTSVSKLQKLVQSYKNSSQVKIKVIALQGTNTGDVLRELYQLSVIKSDFIILRGDIVTNIDLRPALREHMKRANDDDCPGVLTKVFISRAQTDVTKVEGDDYTLISE